MDEVPVPLVLDSLFLQGKASLSVPALRKERSKNYRKLPFGAVPGYAPLSYDRNDPATVDLAYQGRLFRPVPKPDPPFLAEFKAFVQSEVEKLPRVKPLTFDEWIDQENNYNEERKNQLREAFDALKGGRPTRKQASHVDSFIKLESYPEYKYPRMINSRCDAFKAWAGGKIKAVEQAIYDHDFDGIKFIKHVPVPDRPGLICMLDKANMKSGESDYKAFECSFDPKVQDACELPLFRHCLADTPEDAEFICAVDSGVNRMRTRSGARAAVKGRRMSGDLWTSLGNGFTNAMVMKFICHKRGISVSGFVEGDDGLFVYSEVPPNTDFERLGFRIEMKEVPHPNEAHFCGMVFANPNEIMKDPYRVFENFSWTHSFINAGPSIMLELLKGKALCGLFETGQSPIAGVLYREALKFCGSVAPRFIRDGYHVVPPSFVIPEFSPSSETRLLFEQKYGVSVHLQLAVESAIRQHDFQLVAQLMPAPADLQHFAQKYVEET